MINLVLALGSLVGYVLVGTLYYRRMHVKRAIAHAANEKSPGHHGHECAGIKDQYRYHGCKARDEFPCECLNGPSYSAECNCLGPFMAASLWWAVAPCLAIGAVLYGIHKLATPDVTPPQTRLEKLEERNGELEKELAKMGVKLGE